MQVKHLQTLRVQTDRTLRAAVRNLPSGVADIYGRILAKINSYAEEDRLLAEELLRWVVCARRPLNVSELCCALAIDIGDEELNLDNVPTNTSEIVDACSPLLSIGDKGTVSLVHSTVAQFLLDPSNKASVPMGTGDTSSSRQTLILCWQRSVYHICLCFRFATVSPGHRHWRRSRTRKSTRFLYWNTRL